MARAIMIAVILLLVSLSGTTSWALEVEPPTPSPSQASPVPAPTKTPTDNEPTALDNKDVEREQVYYAKDGRNGLNGSRGLRGSQGPRGLQGPPGPKGRDGKDAKIGHRDVQQDIKSWNPASVSYVNARDQEILKKVSETPDPERIKKIILAIGLVVIFGILILGVCSQVRFN